MMPRLFGQHNRSTSRASQVDLAEPVEQLGMLATAHIILSGTCSAVHRELACSMPQIVEVALQSSRSQQKGLGRNETAALHAFLGYGLDFWPHPQPASTKRLVACLLQPSSCRFLMLPSSAFASGYPASSQP
jgi:hypothetical protein